MVLQVYLRSENKHSPVFGYVFLGGTRVTKKQPQDEAAENAPFQTKLNRF
jgi:hypothetical protein